MHAYRIVPAETIGVSASSFPYRVAVEPAHERGDIEAVAIIVEAHPGIEMLRREAVPENVGEAAGLCDCLAVGVVLGDGLIRRI